MLRELAWSGIPADLRPTCWQLLLGYAPPNRERRWARSAMCACPPQRQQQHPDGRNIHATENMCAASVHGPPASQPMPLLGCQVPLCLQLPGSLSTCASSFLYSHACNGCAVLGLCDWPATLGLCACSPSQNRHVPHAQQPHQASTCAAAHRATLLQ